jgi:diguanylate cyclase
MEKYLSTKGIAKGILMQVIQLFQTHRITPTPINYAVFYEFCMAKNQDILKAVNESFRSKDGFTDIVGYRIYQQYIKSVPDDIVHVTDEMSDASKNLAETLREVSTHIDTHIELIDAGASTEELSAELAALKIDIEATQAKAVIAVKEANAVQGKIAHVTNHVHRDPITKLYSRVKIEHDYLLLKNSSVNPGLILFDMDGFSSINKEHGALVGENLLRHIGKLVKQVVGSNHAYRIGGHDEFCVMTGVPLEDPSLNVIANQISTLISAINLRRKGTTEIIAKDMTVTAMLFGSDSIGITRGYEEAKNEIRMIKRNKRLQKQKKESGR